MGAARRRLALQHLQPEHLGVEPDCLIHVAHPHPGMQQLLHLHRRTYLPIGLSDSREWPCCCQAAPTRGAESRACVLDLFRLIQHRSEEHTSELQSLAYLVCRLLLEKKKLVY